MKDVIILSGTGRNNFDISKKIQDSLNRLGTSNELVDLESLELPLYTPDKESSIPEKAENLSEMLINSKALVLMAPEYNGSIPPVVSNAIAWISRTGGDWRKSFNGKFSVVGTHSGGGGLKVCLAMRDQLEHLGSIVLPRRIIVNYSKPFTEKSCDEIMSQLKDCIN